jgi:hypothetical protein
MAKLRVAPLLPGGARCGGPGFDAAVRSLPAGPALLAADGPHVLDWAALVTGFRRAVNDSLGIVVETRDVRDDLASWPDILARTSSAVLHGDPDFGTIPDGGRDHPGNGRGVGLPRPRVVGGIWPARSGAR